MVQNKVARFLRHMAMAC